MEKVEEYANPYSDRGSYEVMLLRSTLGIYWGEVWQGGRSVWRSPRGCLGCELMLEWMRSHVAYRLAHDEAVVLGYPELLPAP